MNLFTVALLVTLVIGVAVCENDRAMAVGFLGRYGYLSSLEGSDHEVARAVRKFQAFHGLIPSGSLDKSTVNLMKLPRCGVPDVSSDLLSKRYETKGPWSKHQLTYYLQPGEDLSQDEQKQAFAAAMKMWSDVTNLTFSEVNSASSADLKISFGGRSHEGTSEEKTCEYPFGSSTLAHAYYPEDGRLHFNEDYTFTLKGSPGTDLMWVAVHEIGHSLGLGHSSLRNAIMYPYYTGYTPNMKLHSDDIAGIQALYGKKIKQVCQGPRALVSGGELTASSEYSANHAASQGVLNYQKNSGSWSARTNDYNQWLQVDLGKTMKVTRVATQGRYSGYNQWVTKYKLQYSDDGVNFQYYKEQGQTTDKEFTGNMDQNTVVYNDLNPPISARYIRFRPTAWNEHISMRTEVYGCQVEENCQESLVTGEKLTASSEYSANHAASQGVLNYKEKSGSWSARTNDLNQWLQVDLGKNVEVARVATQGRYSGYNQWVTKYKLQYSDDGVNFRYYKERGQTTDKEFAGNADQNTVVYHDLNPPITARYVRFRPTAWDNHISMRAGMYGCQG